MMRCSATGRALATCQQCDLVRCGLVVGAVGEFRCWVLTCSRNVCHTRLVMAENRAEVLERILVGMLLGVR